MNENGKMTIKEFYEWAKKMGYEDFTLTCENEVMIYNVNQYNVGVSTTNKEVIVNWE